MAKSKFLIAVTPAEPAIDEGAKIESLLRAGWHRVHMRHPMASRTDMRNIIESIGQEYHSRLVLHGHFDLINDFNLGGLHLNRRCPTAPALYNGPLSRSCHSIDEVRNAEGMEYVTLSPILDSISKDGYRSAFTLDKLMELVSVTTPVIALGGITGERIKDISCFNFSGYAMLGAIPWHSRQTDVYNFAINTIKLC